MTPTTWTEKTTPPAVYYEGHVAGTIDDGFCLFGMPIPLSGALIITSSNAAWTERTTPASSWSEKTAPGTAWVEKQV